MDGGSLTGPFFEVPLNLGLGFGLTSASATIVTKMIIGRAF